MKKQIITLRGQDFNFTETAEHELRAYLKELGRATVIQKSAYLECTEALRDVLHDKVPEGKTVTQKMVAEAIAIVGVPPVTPENVFASVKLALHDIRVKLLKFEGGWRDVRQLVLAVITFLTLFAGIFIGAAAVLLVLFDHLSRHGTYQEFSYGVVRMSQVVPYTRLSTVVLVAVMLFVSGVLLTFCSYWLLRGKHKWQSWVGVVIGAMIFGAAFLRLSSTADTVPYLRANQVYLQACGGEVPMYLPESDPFPTYRQLSSEGYRLAANIPTDHATMRINTAVLCKRLTALRQHGKTPVLQLYKTAQDGSALPYDQFKDVSGNWSFGLFVRS